MQDVFNPNAFQRQLDLLVYAFIGFAVVVAAAIFVVMFFVARHDYGPRIARKQMLLAGIVLASLVSIIVPLVYFGERPMAGQSFLSILNIVLPIGLWVVMAVVYVRNRGAGAVLLDLGPMPYRTVSFVVAGLWFLMALGTLFATIPDKGFTVDTAGELLIRLSIGSSSSLTALRRVQIRERGLLFGSLVAWSKMQAYGWEPAKRNVLILRVRSRFPWGRELNIPVPEQQCHAVEALLAQHVPPASTLREQPAT